MAKNLRNIFILTNLLLLAFANISLFAQTARDAPPPPPPPRAVRTVTGTVPIPAQDNPPANSTVRGRVFYENTGRPVRRSSIMLMPKDGGGGPGSSGSGLTDGNGYFEIKGVTAGTYYAIVNAPGVVSPIAYADFTQSRESEGMKNIFKNFSPIEVNGINDVQVEIAAKQGGAISGRVTYSNGDTAIGVRVEILRKVEDKFVPVISNFSSIMSMFGGGGSDTDDRGVYRYAGLPDGEYIVKVTEKASHGNGSDDSMMGPFGGMFGTGSLLSVYFPNVLDTSDAEIIRVILGQENYETNLTIPDRDLFAIEGKVISAVDGKPIANAKFALKRVGDTSSSLFGAQRMMGFQNRSDETGVWMFKELPPGTYNLTVEPPNPDNDYEDADQEYMGNVAGNNRRGPNKKPEPKYAMTTQEIVISGQDISNLTIKLGYGAVITGTATTENSRDMPENLRISVTDENGEELVDAAVYNYSGDSDKMDSKDENTNRTRAATRSDTNHGFRLEGVPVGKVLFQVFVDDEKYYVKSATFRGTNLLIDPLELNEGDKLDGVKIVLAKDVGSVDGTILNADKDPVTNLDFALVPTDAGRRRISSFYRFVSTDSEGKFSTSAAPDEYAIVIFNRSATLRDQSGFHAWLDGVIGDAPKVTIRAGETSTVTVRLP